VTELILVRHSQPHSGVADPGLTAHGVELAAATARWLAHDTVEVVLSSPLRRAMETAAPIAAALGLPVVTFDGLLEWEAVPPRPHYVRLEEVGLEHPANRSLHEGRYEDFRPLGFDEPAFVDGAALALREIFDRWPVGRIVAVAHGGIINALVASVLEPRDGFFFFMPGYTGISILERVPAGRTVVRTVNDTGHLLGERRPGSTRPSVLDG
jgi:probable phosphoglycerate mutase